MQLEARLARGIDFMIHKGCKPPFTETWVFVSNSKVHVNSIEVEQYLNLTFADLRLFLQKLVICLKRSLDSPHSVFLGLGLLSSLAELYLLISV